MRLLTLRRVSPLLLALAITALAAPRLAAEPPRSVTTTVTVTPEGAAVSTGVVGVGEPHHPSRVLVKFRHGARAFLPGSAQARGFTGDADLFVVSTPPGLSVAETVHRYKASPHVVYAEPDFEVRTLDTIPNDFRWPEQWDMVKIAAPHAWDTQTNAADVVVAIVDTGIDFGHPDLAGNVDAVNSFTCINGPCVGGGVDDYGHGTHVAGTIGAVANSGTSSGIVGINWSARMISLKFLNAGGSGFISDAVSVFNKIAALKAGGLNIRVTNNSWGGGGFSQALKDAMAAVEALGIVNVCAAGNNGQNADPNPAYPAAYDNRGIVSVLASDLNDVGAGFTNYGLANVDIAAPGVSTLSTVPVGPCPLCDASGYKLLSGTSMATPHVAGVMAALLHLKPSLTAHQARDMVLDPASYDVVSDARAKSTSTGGRLNFYKVITNPRANTPVTLNNFPMITMGPNVSASAGGAVNLSATVGDPDPADVAGLRTQWSKLVSTGTSWLFGWMVGAQFPDANGASASFTAPSLGRIVTVPYSASVADNRGGGATGSQLVTVSPASPGLPPSGTLTLSATTGNVGDTIRINFPVTDPDGTLPAWDMWAAGLNGSSGWCCFSGSFVDLTFNGVGVYRIGVQAMDRKLNASERKTDIVRIGGATGTPPMASAILDQLSGPVPLTVNVNMSASAAAPGSSISYYFIGCGTGFTPASATPMGSCTFDTPGIYWLLLQVQDNAGLMDLVSMYVVATPASGGGGGDTTPPTVTITAPASGATVSAPITVSADASDAGGSGVKKVEFRLDNPTSGTIIGTVLSSPFSFTWNPSGTSTGGHTLYAIATDNANNVGTSAGVGITIPPPPPPPPSFTAFTLTPANPTRKSTATIAATVSSSVTRVEFYINGSLVSNDTTSPFSYSWKIPAAMGKTYALSARAYNAAGQFATSNTITVSPR